MRFQYLQIRLCSVSYTHLDIGNADNNADKYGVRRTHNTGSCKTENSDNQGIQKLAADKTAEGAVHETDVFNKSIGTLDIHGRIHGCLLYTSRCV